MPYYYSKKQESPLNLKKIKCILRGKDLEFYTGSGVFSKNKVDSGTKLLAENAYVEDVWRVLDMGCGYGAVGITINKVFPDTEVLMVDINKRAVKLAKMNVKLNDAKAEAMQSDLYENIKEKFNSIIANPPQRAGKEVCFKIIEDSKKYLVKDGLLQLVARHQKGGKELGKRMELVFGNIRETAKKSGYRVYVSRLS